MNTSDALTFDGFTLLSLLHSYCLGGVKPLNCYTSWVVCKNSGYSVVGRVRGVEGSFGLQLQATAWIRAGFSIRQRTWEAKAFLTVTQMLFKWLGSYLSAPRFSRIGLPVWMCVCSLCQRQCAFAYVTWLPGTRPQETRVSVNAEACQETGASSDAHACHTAAGGKTARPTVKCWPLGDSIS